MHSRHSSSVIVGTVVAALVTGPVWASHATATNLPLSRAAHFKPDSTLAAKKKPTKSTLRVVLSGSGSYTVTGKGFRKTAQSSKSFKVAAGAYKVSAPGASVSPGSVKVKPGKKVTVTVAFPVAPVVTPPVVSPPVQTPPPSDPTTPPPADTTPPGRVSGLTVGTRTVSSIGLSWTNPGDADLAEVIVRRAQGGTAPATPTAGSAVTLGSPKATSVTDTGLSADTQYSYAVFTRDDKGNVNLSSTKVTTSTTPGPGVSGPVQRVSVDASDAQANRDSYQSTWSPDGTRIAFISDASNLVTGDTNGFDDVFVKTLATGAIQRVNTDATGTQANGSTYDPQWSPDGTQIAFSSKASDLVAGDTNNTADVFVKTLATGAIQRISLDATGTQVNGDTYGYGSYEPYWSPDGTQIAFTSYATNLVAGDTNASGDAFVKTLATGAIQRITVDATGTQANGYSDSPTWSPDGTRIAFRSDASNLVPGDTNGFVDRFVKTLATGAIQRITVDATGTQANGDTYDPQWWSPDGTRIAFTSDASNLVAGDTNGCSDVFVKTLATGAIQRVNTDATGTQANAESSDSYSARWSPDGTQIAFSSFADNLVAGDTGGYQDVFVKTLATGAIQRITVDATGTQANSDSYQPTWSPDGTQIAFTSTASNLVTGDTGGYQDVFVKTLNN